MAFFKTAQSWSVLSRVLAAAAVTGVIVFVFYKHAHRPVAVASAYAEACEATRSLAQRAFASEAVRGVELGECAELNLREQKDFSWLSSGSSAATRYGEPITLEWSARVAAFPQGMRLCNFGFDASRSPRPPVALAVQQC